MNIPDRINAPIENGQKVGEVVFKLDNEQLAKINVVTRKQIKKVGFFNNSSHVFEKWINLCR